jgi:hypothetical protein
MKLFIWNPFDRGWDSIKQNMSKVDPERMCNWNNNKCIAFGRYSNIKTMLKARGFALATIR